MRPRTAVALLVLAFLLGAFVAFYELRDPAEREPAEAGRTRLFPGVEAEQIDAIELVGPEGPLARAERRDDGWWLVEPLRFDGDDTTLDGMAATLAGAAAEARIEPRGDGGLGEFGLDPAERELRFRAGGAWHGLRIGRRTPVGGNTYVGLAEGGEVFSVPSWRTNGLSRSVNELRNSRVLSFDPPAVSRLRASWPGGGVRLERRGDSWWLVEPVSALADANSVEGLLSDLSFLRAGGFIDAPLSLVELGLDEPAFALELSGDGLELEFALGAEREGRRAARGAAGALFEVASERLDDFPRELAAWRDKSLARFEPVDASRLEIHFAPAEPSSSGTLVVLHRQSGGWRDEANGVSPQRVAELVAELARLEAVDIAAESLGEVELGELGLAPPRVRLRVFAAGSTAAQVAPLCDVSIGVGDSFRGFFAQRADSPQVFRLAAELAEQLPGSLADWQTRFAAGSDDASDEIEAAEPQP